MQGTAQSKNYNYVALIVEWSPFEFVKVLFSDNNSDVFEWNWLLLGTLIDMYLRCCTKQEL